jgi:ribosome maturation factor RimP
MDLEARLFELCEAGLVEAGYELVLVEVVGLPRRQTVRIFIDREGGVSVEDCARASRLIDPLIEHGGVFDHAYVLEVSSPGLDRPLVKAGDYERFAGRKAKLKLRMPLAERKNFTGILRGLREGSLVELELDGGKMQEIPLDAVFHANLVYEWK